MKVCDRCSKLKCLIHHSKANLDEKIVCGKIKHLLRPNNNQNACKGFVWESRIPHSILVNDLCSIDVYIVSLRF